MVEVTIKRHALWPLAFRPYLSVFKEVGDHDDDLGVLLPHHLPKGRKSALNRTLSGNVGSRLAETVHEIRIEVVLGFFDVIIVGSSFRPQSNTGVII